MLLRFFRLVLASFAPALLLFAHSASALTFDQPSAFAYSGPVTFLADPTLQDNPNGFNMQTDVALGAGTSFLIGYRHFQVGPLPEQLESLAQENFKIVLSGGGSGSVSVATLTATTHYTIWSDLAPGLANDAPGGSGTVSDNAFTVVTSILPNVLDQILPTQGILSPGGYVLRAFVKLEFTPEANMPFPQSAFAELGGMSSFTGISISAFGTAVPEPTTALLVGVGVACLAWRQRARAAARAD